MEIRHEILEICDYFGEPCFCGDERLGETREVQDRQQR
jgi:hypothetical protein